MNRLSPEGCVLGSNLFLLTSIISQLDAQLLCHLIFKLYQEGIFTYLCFLLEEIPCSLANIMCFITELFLNNMRSNCLI